jgi:hypothetical protein
MGEITLYIVQGIITLIAFYLGAWIYHRGQMDKSPSPTLNLNQTETEELPNWDQV